MKLISFDALRTLKFPEHTYVKPEHMFAQKDALKEADFVLFPEYWQINGLLFGLNARIFPSEATYRIGHDKIEMTRAFELVCPNHVPITLIHGNTPYWADQVLQHFDFPFVAKIPKSSMGEGVFLIETPSQWRDYLAKTEVIYAQERLPIDRDLRLIVIGKKVIGGYWRLQSDNGFHNNISQGGTMMEGQLPISAVELVERVAAELGVDHAGFDVAMVGQHAYLFEFNRLFGTQGVNSLLGDVTPHILEYLQSQLDQNDPIEPDSPKTGKNHRRRLRRVA